MAITLRTVFVSAAVLAAVCASSSASARTNLRDRAAAAIQSIEKACSNDIKNFCGMVTPGEGRQVVCLQAYDDQLSRNCQFTLYRESRRLKRSLHRVERIADACWNDIEKHCADADRIGQCIAQKKTSFSWLCQRAFRAVRQAAHSLAEHGVAELKGMAVYSSDNKDLGRVVEVTRGPDGKILSIKVEVGRALGLGHKVVVINADAFQELADRVRLRINSDEANSLPDTEKQ